MVYGEIKFVLHNCILSTNCVVAWWKLPDIDEMSLLSSRGKHVHGKEVWGHFLSSQVQCTVPEFTAHGQSWIWRRSADFLVFCNREATLHCESVTPSLRYETNSHLEAKITFILKSSRCTFLANWLMLKYMLEWMNDIAKEKSGWKESWTARSRGGLCTFLVGEVGGVTWLLGVVGDVTVILVGAGVLLEMLDGTEDLVLSEKKRNSK